MLRLDLNENDRILTRSGGRDKREGQVVIEGDAN